MIVVYCADRLTDRRCNAVAQLPATIPCNFGLGIPTETWDTRGVMDCVSLELLSVLKEWASSKRSRNTRHGNILQITRYLEIIRNVSRGRYPHCSILWRWFYFLGITCHLENTLRRVFYRICNWTRENESETSAASKLGVSAAPFPATEGYFRYTRRTTTAPEKKCKKKRDCSRCNFYRISITLAAELRRL